MYATDYSVIETPFKKLYNSVLQLSGPHKRRLKTGYGSLTKWVWCPYIKPTNKHTHVAKAAAHCHNCHFLLPMHFLF